MNDLKKLIEAHRQHTEEYINCFSYNIQTTHHLKRFFNKTIKVRIYNLYFDDITYNLRNHSVLLGCKNYYNNNIKDLSFNKNRNLYFRFHIGQEYLFPILNIYQTETHTVLYSFPDATTLTKAYNNDPIVADILLSNFNINAETRKEVFQKARLNHERIS